jgi:hypothetical protein
MRFTKHNNPSKRRRTRKLTETERERMDEARLLMLEAERKGDHEGSRMIAIALNATINK